MPSICVLDNLAAEGIELLKSDARIQFDVRTGLADIELRQTLDQYDGVILRSGVKITADSLEGNTRLKAIVRAGVGTDNIDKQAATYFFSVLAVFSLIGKLVFGLIADRIHPRHALWVAVVLLAAGWAVLLGHPGYALLLAAALALLGTGALGRWEVVLSSGEELRLDLQLEAPER